jgi:hypothetical protein
VASDTATLPTRRIIVIGGFGNFGARICRALAGDPRVEVVATTRSSRTNSTQNAIARTALNIDSHDFASALRALAPHIVIHCAGPFQKQDYRVASAAIASGAHYIDLADGRRFVAQFRDALDLPARTAGVLALSGASTLPALSSAVVDALLDRFAELREIDITIAPGQRAPRGAATIAAVLSYAGKPFKWLRGGKWLDAWGWQELRRVRVGDTATRLSAACDVPDLELFPRRYPSVRTVTFRAALELDLQHIVLWLAAAMRRAGVLLPLERWSGAIAGATKLLDRFGSDTGGMIVALRGINRAGGVAHLEWRLTARSSHGPEIPCMAAILVARKLIEGKLTVTGAFPCMGFLELTEFEQEFARWDISILVHDESRDGAR